VADRIAVVLGRCFAHRLVHPNKPSVADPLHVNADQPGCVGELNGTRTHRDRQPRRSAAFLGIGNIPFEFVGSDVFLRLCGVRNAQLFVALDHVGKSHPHSAEQIRHPVRVGHVEPKAPLGPPAVSASTPSRSATTRSAPHLHYESTRSPTPVCRPNRLILARHARHRLRGNLSLSDPRLLWP